MKPKYYGKAKNINVVKRVPFAWRSWAIVGAIKTYRDAIIIYKHFIDTNSFPPMNPEFDALIKHNQTRVTILLSKFETMLCNEPAVGSMYIQKLGNVYQLLRVTHINSELRVGTFTVVRVGTKEECERARDMFYGN